MNLRSRTTPTYRFSISSSGRLWRFLNRESLNVGTLRLEHPSLRPPKTLVSENRRTESGTVDDQPSREDPDLTDVVQYWPKLTTPTRMAILALATTGETDPSKTARNEPDQAGNSR